MTESSNLHTVEYRETSTKKKRRVVENINNSEANIFINPVSQQLNKPNMVAPDFNCAAYINNESIRIQLSNLLYKYKAVVLFFYEADL